MRRTSDSTRYLKMACGENPKNTYGASRGGVLPYSRMGVAWTLRKMLDDARSLVTRQNDWCENPSTTERLPEDVELEQLVELLRGRMNVHVHCYEVHDMQMMLRLSDEYQFDIHAFHHALEAWRIPDLLLNRGVTAAIFADKWGFKLESYDGTPHAASILHEAGVKVALKTDHPVISAKLLMHQAAIAHSFGLPDYAAIAGTNKKGIIFNG